jgi:hypothetical protein
MTTARSTWLARPDRLGQEVTALSATVPARDRVVAVDEPLASMLPDGGLQRGRVVGCEGPAACSLAVATVVAAVRAGSWLALVGVPTIGLEAIAEFGVPMGRVVAVRGGSGPTAWAERVAAAADGFEMILTRPPLGAERAERKLRHRLQARGTILVTVAATTSRFGADLTFSTSAPCWAGIGRGHGRLTARTVEVRLVGRRIPHPVERTVWLPAPDGRPGAHELAVRDRAPALDRVG